MNITVKWDNPEKTIIHQAHTGKWTGEEFYVADLQIRKMMDMVSHQVDLIIDMQNNSHLPLNTIGHFRHTLRNRPANGGQIVIVSSNAFVQATMSLIKRVVTSHQIVVVATLDEALEHLHRARSGAKP